MAYWGRRGRERMIVGFTTTYAISAYHHWCVRVRISIRARCTTLCDRVCQWLATGRWFSPGWNIVESCVKHNETIPILTFIHLQISQVATHLEAIRTYIRSRIEKERESFDPENIRNFLDLYIAEEGKTDSKISGILWKKRNLTVMVNNSANINKPNNHLSPQIIESFMNLFC